MEPRFTQHVCDSTAALAIARLYGDTGGEISIKLTKGLSNDEQYFRYEGIIDGLPEHALPTCVVHVGKSPNIRARKHVIMEALNHMPRPDEWAVPEHTVSHYEVRDYSHMFKSITVVIEKRPSRESLSLWDYIRRLEQSKGPRSRLPTTANPLRYDIGNWLGHFHNWGSEEKVVKKLQDIVRVPRIMETHRKYISRKLNKALYRLPRHSEQTLSQARGLIQGNYFDPGNIQPFQMINGRFDLEKLHIMSTPLDKRVNPEQVPSVYVSDWRGCCEGHPVFDLGPLMADLVVLSQQNTTLADGVAQGFIQGYFAKVRNDHHPSKKFICHLLVHAGVFVFIRCLGLSEKKNDDIGEDQNTGKDQNNNIGKDNNPGRDDNTRKINNHTGKANGNGTANYNGDPEHTKNGNSDQEIFEYALQIIQNAVREDSEWFLDKPVLRYLFELSPSKGYSGPGRWELANKSEKSGDESLNINRREGSNSHNP